MHKLHSSLKLAHLSIATAVNLGTLATATPAIAEIVPDATLPNNSIVTPNDNSLTIDGGTVAGSNLFHSFSEFSVPTGAEAFFNNATTIDNIITRVTGGNSSNIDGLIRANGSANLFLLNPNGIVFGANAQLDIGGSFFGTTADRFIFEDGSFYSAGDPQTLPLLTINVPAGVQFGAAPGPIQVQGTGHNLTRDGRLPIRENRPVGVSVQIGRTLALVGGDVVLAGGNITALSGRVELGSVQQGIVSIKPTAIGWELDYAEVENFADIRLTQEASVDTSGDNSQVQLVGRNISLTNSSAVISNTLGEIDGGTFTVRATESVELINNDSNTEISTSLFNQVEPTATGNGGNLTIEASLLAVSDGGQIEGSTFGAGNAGELAIRSSEIEIIGRNSGLRASVQSNATGDGGSLTIEADRLLLQDGGQIGASTFGVGNAGNIVVHSAQVEAIGRNSSLVTSVISGATGDGGSLTIKTDRLLLRDGGQVVVSTDGSGNAGNIAVRSTRIEQIGRSSGLATSVFPDATGNGGSLTIDANSLTLRDGAQIQALTLGSGNAGNILVRSARIEVIGTAAEGRVPSVLVTSVGAASIGGSQVTGDGGSLTIEADRLILRDGGRIGASTFGLGKGGDIVVRSSEIDASGTSPNGRTPSALAAVTRSIGEGGTITINTERLTVSKGAQLTVRSEEEALAGTLIVEAENILLDSGLINAETEAGSQGTIQLSVSNSLTLRNEAAITTSTGDGLGGRLSIQADEITLNSDSIINTEARGKQGSAGSMFITANQLRLNNSALNADTFNTLGDAIGNIDLNTSALSLENHSEIRTEARGGNATGGNITITTDILAAVENSDISANAPAGAGGNIEITADNIFGAEFRSGVLDTPLSDITATGATAASQGTVQLNTSDVDSDVAVVELPDSPIDAASLIGQDICSQGKNSEFIITGRGGIPSAPTDLLPGVALWEDIRPPLASRETPSSEPVTKLEKKPQRLVEALGWYRNSEGVVMLTANPTQVTSHNVGVGLLPHPGCNVNQW